MPSDLTTGTIDIKGQRVEARQDASGAVTYFTAAGKWRSASASAAATFAAAPPVKVCTKDPCHEWRVTKSGGYCYTEDRIIAERQKAERAAAKAASA